MRTYFIKRILLIFPTLIIVSVISFFLSRSVPQDQTTLLLSLRGIDDKINNEQSERQYEAVYKELGLHLPLFYFSVLPSHYPRNLSSIVASRERELTKKLLAKSYSLESIQTCISSLRLQYQNDIARNDIEKFYVEGDIGILQNSSHESLHTLASELIASRVSFYIPSFHWHGFDNQYHNWVKSFFDGSFGLSIADGMPAFHSVKKAFLWTITLAFFAIIFTFSIGIFLGYFVSLNPKGKTEKAINIFLFILYSIPIFWISTMAVMFFTTDDFGVWTNVFPSVGIDIYPGESTFYHIKKNLNKFILPVMCASIQSLALIARMLRRSILNEMKLPYILTAFSKGLNKKQVVKNHAFPNSLLPIITLLVGALPSTLGGSVIIEVIFNIPGIGRLMYNAIGIADWNVVFCILMIVAFITIVSYLIGDILYAYLDPKIRLA